MTKRRGEIPPASARETAPEMELPPVPAGDYDHALHVDNPEAPSLLQQYLDNKPKPGPRLGGKPKQTADPDAQQA